jgi:hypothetical protein
VPSRERPSSKRASDSRSRPPVLAARPPRPPGCSKAARITALPRAIQSQSVSLTVADPRTQRGSYDGQRSRGPDQSDPQLCSDLVFLGGRSWDRTSDPSLVRIVTTTPPPLLRPYRPRSALAEASSSAQESAPLSKPRSHPRSHPWAAARRRRLGPREPAHVACVLLRRTLRLRLRRSPDGPSRLELGRPCRPRARRAGHRGADRL